ncbi:MAG: 2-oxoglutarate and iron-dependent oxygenase domain-containing protein [Alphaproteobacteria bacterium]
MHLFERHAPADMDAAAARIPVLDLGPYFAGAAGARAALAAEIRQACEDVGFFYIRRHGIPDAPIARAFAESKRFHALPLAAKQALSLDAGNIGYLAMNASTQGHSTVHRATKPNQNESYFVTHETDPAAPGAMPLTPKRGRNAWPDGLPGFREGVMAYFDAVHALAQKMLPAFSVSLGMAPDFLAPMFTDGGHVQLRFLHYPPTRIGDNDFGTGPHTDNSFFTILARMDVPGLRIRMPSGEWVVPPLIPGTLLVNIGNYARRMSNDRFLSTPHGVIVEGDADRYAIAYFHSPTSTNVISVLPPFVDADHPPKYEPALMADLIQEFWSANYAHQPGFGTVAPRHRHG